MSEIAKLLGKRIRSMRKSMGLTQQGFGELAGLNYKYLGSIERGRENPSLKKLAVIARAFGVEVMELFQFHHEHENPEILREELRRIIEQEDGESVRTYLKLLKALRL